jgi:cyclopropane fatty-acyl-phospholipid synthase-like methyltransferase
MSTLPRSEACERNKAPILTLLLRHFAELRRVLEIGSGTGQHALHFAPALPHLLWQTSERAAELAVLRTWLADSPQPNLPSPLALDVSADWPTGPWDGMYSANTLHIMAWNRVEAFFRGVGTGLEAGGVLAVYGPFNYAGRFSSDSNAVFDRWLRERDPQSGIRDIEAVHALAHAAGLDAVDDHAMPANNRLLVWRRVRGAPQTPRL